ncbi:ABC transporter ATP-binding protein [Humidisolicoccus flavus]|uniref:ABC transporter ATP-binding protein n=1 Tax=Humidisolicoccus flavus TaxID=3111414 RepID=UPI003250C6E8
MSLVELREVTRRVQLPTGELVILNGVDFSAEEGDRIAIVGRSGSGKSTLLNILGLLDLPSSGSMQFDGRHVVGISARQRDRIRGENVGFVFQQFNLIEGLTVLENVLVPLMNARGRMFWRRRSIAIEMLERVGLGERLDSLPTKLSGGEQQRVAIARALVRRPRLILADEPTGALDLETGAIVMELLEDVAAESESALVTITHDVAVAGRFEQVYRLDAGHLRRDHVEVAA